MSIDLNSLTPEQLAELSRQALMMAKEKKSGIPTADPEVVKLAGTVQNLAMKMGIDPEKIIFAIGRNFKEPIHFRAYAPYDASKPRKPRGRKPKAAKE